MQAVLIGLTMLIPGYLTMFPVILDENGSRNENKRPVKMRVSVLFPYHNYTTNVEDKSAVETLRRKLHELYHIYSDGGGDVLLHVSGYTPLRMRHSPLHFSKNFAFSLIEKQGKTVTHLNESSKFGYRYDPCCIVHTMMNDGVFNLCAGANGYFTVSSERVTVIAVMSRFDDEVSHHSFRRRVSGEAYNNITETPFSGQLLQNERKRVMRLRRDDEDKPIRYLELYLVADYDYYTKCCNSSLESCQQRIFRILTTVALRFLVPFNLRIVLVGLDIFNSLESANVVPAIVGRIPNNKKSSPSANVLDWMRNYIDVYNRDIATAPNDNFIYLTNTADLSGGYFEGRQAHLAYIPNSTCHGWCDQDCGTRSNIYIDMEGYSLVEINRIIFSLALSMGARPVTRVERRYGVNCACGPQGIHCHLYRSESDCLYIYRVSSNTISTCPLYFTNKLIFLL